jgi:hypothetical protein
MKKEIIKMDTIYFYKLFGGIFALLLGIFVLIVRIKKPIEPTEDVNKDNLRGFIGSILAIVFGIILIINSFG